ncbi:hypothetical protein N7532_011942 [Penicillium argentinense]|uniref:FAD-binding domain-containing protein n=1 Tax=Penicillium argentinense TaxID=1131581 RepID=A0A9W9EJI7_9EURO|nr:uncharacterized protein N7532_011942 [Penicillium argentinense]KAJ5082899.1 hypothetical protein N7532_011942 [Penicillium argentinense]
MLTEAHKAGRGGQRKRNSVSACRCVPNILLTHHRKTAICPRFYPSLVGFFSAGRREVPQQQVTQNEQQRRSPNPEGVPDMRQGEGAVRAANRWDMQTKDCNDQAPGAHRRQKSTKSSIEVSALEEKLDRMVALLTASNPSALESSGPNLSSGMSSTAFSDESAANPSDREGQFLLKIFTTSMVPLFPFVVIPPHMTADQLRQEKPFLFLAISMVACQSASRQREISKMVKDYIAEKIVIRNERSLDLLQGLLVHLAWYIGISRQQRSTAPDQEGEVVPGFTQQQVNQGPAQLDAFVQLAVAQLISLGLGQSLNPPRMSKPISYMGKMDVWASSQRVHTLEEQRAYLGCYYLTVMLSSCVRDMEPLRFTKYTKECCKRVEEALEFPTDAYLVNLIRVMHLADRIVHTISFNDLDYPEILSAPLGLSIQGFQAELQKIKASFSCEPPHSSILAFHCNTLEILLYQIALSEELSDAQCGGYTVTRLDILFHCLEATKSFFHNFYSVSSQYFPFLPFTIWCQSGHAVVTLSRLSLFQSYNDWDLEYVRSTIDYNDTIDRLAQKLEEARSFIQPNIASDELPEIFGRLSSRMRLMKESHRQKKEAMEKAQHEDIQNQPDFSFMFSDSFFIGPTAIRAVKKWPDMARENAKIEYRMWMSWHQIDGKKVAGPSLIAMHASKNGETSVDGVEQPTNANRHSRPKFHNILSNQTKRIRLSMEYSKQAFKFYENPNTQKAVVVLADDERLEADVVIAADGIGSKSFTVTMGREIPAHPSGSSLYRGSIPIESVLADPLLKERFHGLEDGLSLVEMWQGHPKYHSIWERTTDHLAWQFITPDGMESWTKLVNPETVSPKGRVVQIGDAAHTFHPASGSGATQGLEDAVSLAVCLQITQKDNIPWATRVHNKLRFERVSLLQKIGILNALSRSLPADEEEPKAAHAGLLGAWRWKHDPEKYAIDNYGKALEHLNNGAPFQNTNLPRGCA